MAEQGAAPAAARRLSIWQAAILGDNAVLRELLDGGEDIEAICLDKRPWKCLRHWLYWFLPGLTA